MATDNKYPVPVYTQKHGFIRVEDGATAGATVGTNVYNEDGTIFVPGGGTIGDIDGLQAALDAKVDDSQVGAANGVAPLDAGGKISTSYLPSLAITEVFTVSSQAAMLALAADEGDVAIRTDLSPTRAYILTQSPASTLANWQDITGAYTDWSQITNKPSTFTPSAHTHAIADVTNLQTELNNRAVIGSTPRFSAMNIGADGDVYVYEGAANQLNIRVGPSTAYKYFGFNADGAFTAPGPGSFATSVSIAGNTAWHGGNAHMQAAADADANALTRPGEWAVMTTTGPNRPSTYSTVVNLHTAGSYGIQVGGSFANATEIWMRTKWDNGGFNPWRKLWHDGNFNPATKADASTTVTTNTAQTLTVVKKFSSSATSGTVSTEQPLTVFQGTAGADAFMTFHVAGDSAFQFGLDGTTNDLFVGGWSKGAVKYKVFHEGNFDPATKYDKTGGTITGNVTLSAAGNEFYRAAANSTTQTRQPRTFVQSADPGAAAADGDLWIY